MSKRIKAPAVRVPVPASVAEASRYIAEIGEAQRRHDELQAQLNRTIADVKAAFEERAEPLRSGIEAWRLGVQIWAEANRAELTQHGRTKTVKLPTGEIAWRQRPPAVRLSGIDAVIEAIKSRGLPFLRVKEEVNKEALLAEPELAVTLPGVSIGSAGEEFVVTPVGLQLAEGVS